MATDLYAGFTNPIAGETFRCISFSKEAFTIDWVVQPEGYVPFEHIHINQAEIFHVKSGEMRILIDGQKHIVKTGDSITVPKGKRHIAFNNKPEVMNCTVEYRPGLDNFKFFQCFGGLTLDEDYNKKGQINIPKMCYFTKKMNAQCITRPTSIPAPVFKMVINLFFMVGTVLGWNKLYTKYTGEY
ncbi:cupin domain-containing protein [Runella salmonicolor]|uniref:Cupin domain-containing protein n=1 Tax=Runella salmonicolor TaxID=2950278 RepID=A0ABT1FSH5_9BACT|nr:cupin domain-containing protein [Runella salmonicolor]MCP1384715.1 cupin domain-containing protein [Runella salmonicolor]